MSGMGKHALFGQRAQHGLRAGSGGGGQGRAMEGKRAYALGQCVLGRSCGQAAQSCRAQPALMGLALQRAASITHPTPCAPYCLPERRDVMFALALKKFFPEIQ